jgi:hypothetical protein
VKSYVGHMMAVPRDWSLFAGNGHHAHQVSVLVRAESKADAAALYVEVGDGGDGAWFAKDVKLAGGGHYLLGNHWQAITDTGAVDERGIYVCHRHVSGDRVVRIESDGTGVIVGMWTMDGRRPTFVATEHAPTRR